MAEQSRCYVPARYVFTFLASVGLAIIYALKVNLSVAIVVMVNQTALAEMAMTSHNGNNRNGSSPDPANVEFACPVQELNNQTSSSLSPSKQDGPFEWSEPTQGLILAAYFWGYIFTQLPGGRVAEMFSAKWVIWGSVMINVVFTLLTPVAAQISYIAVLVVRFIEGLGAGVSLPAIQVMLSKWSLPDERNRLSAFVFAGMSMGTVVSLPFSGFLAETFGWQWVFYVLGGLAAIWCILWIFLVFDSPQQHPRLYPEEKKLFHFSLSAAAVAEGQMIKKKMKLSVPWKAIFTSGPFWAILIAHTCKNFGWYMLLVELPTYMKHILRFNIGRNSLLSAIPYFSLWFFSALWSFAMDWSKSKGWLTTTAIRKLSTAVATLLPALCFTGVCIAGCDRNAAIALMTLGAMFMAGAYCGILANSIDIAPNYAGTLMAITNTFATIPGFVVPIFVGQLTHGNQSLERWQIIFGTTSGIMALAFVVYTLLASGEEQPWNKSNSSNNLSSAAPVKGEDEEEEKLNPKQTVTIEPAAAAVVVVDVVDDGNASNNK